MPKIVMVAALELEVEPLVRKWSLQAVEHDGRSFKVFTKGDAALVCGGIGAEPARRATEAMIRKLQPEMILSVGFVGALDPSLRVGEVVEPRVVINASDGSRIDVGQGAGTIVTSSEIAGLASKKTLRDSYSATVVDMEAAAVAQGAEVRGIKFGAVKVVSDEASFSLPPVAAFVRPDGSFRTARFAFHVALRPWFWLATLALARNQRTASRALSSALARYLDRVASTQPAHAGEK